MATTQQKMYAPIVKKIGELVATSRGEVESVLQRNGVIVPQNATDTQLVRIVITAIADSQGFRKDFTALLVEGDASNMAGYTYANGVDLSDFTIDTTSTETLQGELDLDSEDEGSFFKNLLTPDNVAKGLNYLGGIFKNSQDQATAESIAEAERLRIERELLAAQSQSPSRVNWVAIGAVTAVVALLGTTVYLVTRKK